MAEVGDNETRRPGSILFICQMNAIRSPMAEALARHILPDNVLVRSAGLQSGTRDPFVDAVIGELDIPLVPHDPHGLEDIEDDLYDTIVALTPAAHERAEELARTSSIEVIYWPLPDPSTTEGRREQVMNAYREVRDRLDTLIREHFAES